MAQTTTVSTRELKRQAALVFEGQTLNVMLCNVGGSGFDAESTVANWITREIAGSGYARYSEVVGTSSYNATDARQDLPEIGAAFTAAGGPLNYDTVVCYFSGETYLHSIIREDPNVVVPDGQTQTYLITLNQNDQ